LNEVLYVGDPPRYLRLATEAKYDLITLSAGYPILNFIALDVCSNNQQGTCHARAHECVLYWCVNKYKPMLIQGTLEEEILATSKFGRRVQISDIDPYQEDSSYYEFSPIGQDPYTYETRPLHDPTKESFLLGPRATASITNFTSRILTGNVYAGDSTGPVSTNEGVARLYAPISKGDNQHLTTIFQAIATSMTSGLRSPDTDRGNNQTLVDGLELVQGAEKTFVPSVQVSWGWIALPATLHLMTFFMLCSALTYSSHHQMPLWKSSASAAVFFGARIRESMEEEIPSELTEIESMAQKIRTGNHLAQFRK
jgi:hypothetical protein